MTAETLPVIGSQTQTYFKPALSEIKFGRMRFLITDRPTEYGLEHFIKVLQRYGVKTVVRVCSPTYACDQMKKCGIEVVDWEFADGSPPPDELIDKWLTLVENYFGNSALSPGKDLGDGAVKIPANNLPSCLAVHCVAGLGRSPVMVGIALLEAGMPVNDVIFLIRTHRRGALNEKQLEFLKSYKPNGRLRKLRFVGCQENKDRKNCSIM
ncbi:protein tyrosine phosphatase type IVA 3 [Ditylenchus destructor]|nr:protein tyrosine phosphatase type IVA 3 [Ditylenchus destructor]